MQPFGIKALLPTARATAPPQAACFSKELGSGAVNKPHLRRSRGSDGSVIGRDGAGPRGPIRDAQEPRDRRCPEAVTSPSLMEQGSEGAVAREPGLPGRSAHHGAVPRAVRKRGGNTPVSLLLTLRSPARASTGLLGTERAPKGKGGQWISRDKQNDLHVKEVRYSNSSGPNHP